MCEQRNWNTSRLLMALPRADRAKSNVVLHTYVHDTYRTQPLLQWVYGLMKQNVRRLNTGSELSLWLSQSCAADVCLLFISTLTLPPFFLSALSVKFTGRVKFGSCTQRVFSRSGVSVAPQLSQLNADRVEPHPHTSDGNTAAAAASGNYSPNTGQYVVVANGRTVHFGAGRRERLSFPALKTYLKCLAPDINDVFLMSLAFANVLAVMSVFDVRGGSPIQCVLHLFVTLLKYNFILLLFWIVALSVVNWKTTLAICRFCTGFLRRTATSLIGRQLIALWSLASNNVAALGCSFVIFNTIVFYVRRRFFPSTLRQSESWSEWLRSASIANMPIIPDARRFNYLFETGDIRDVSNSLNPALLALARKWNITHIRMHPSLCYDYIVDLPCWIYESETPGIAIYDSEMGNKNAFDRPPKKLCFRCRCVKSLNLRHLSRKLARRPCKKCGFRGGPRQSGRNEIETTKSFLLASPNGGHRFSSDGMDSAVACPICLDFFNVGDVVCGLPCEHVYHQKCILSWLLRDQPSCPCCRWPANETKEKVS